MAMTLGGAPMITALTAAPKLMGAMSGGGGAQPAAGGQVNPFTSGLLGNAFDPNAALPPTPQQQGVMDQTPGLMATELIKRSYPKGRAPSADAFSDLDAPGPATPAKDLTQGPNNTQMIRDQGFDKVTSVTGQPANGNPMAARHSPAGGVFDQPKSVKTQTIPSAFEDVTEIAKAPSGGETSIPRSPAANQQPTAMSSSPVTAFDEPIPGEDDSDAFGSKAVTGVSDWLKGSPTNPLFQTGMGLLASGYDGSNPFSQVNANLQGMSGEGRKQAQEQRAMEAHQQKLSEQGREAELQKMLALIAGSYDENGGRAKSQLVR